jgi:hypothetical protein
MLLLVILCKKCVKQHKKLLFSPIFTQKQKHAQSLDTSAFGHVFQFSSQILFLPNDVPGERICRGDWEAN